MKFEFYKNNKIIVFLFSSIIITTIIEFNNLDIRELSNYFFIKYYLISILIVFSIPTVNLNLKKIFDDEKITLPVIILLNFTVIFLLNYLNIKTNEILIYKERGIEYRYSTFEIIFSVFQHNLSIFGGYIIYFVSYLLDVLIVKEKEVSNRFIVYHQEKIIPIKLDYILCFYLDKGNTYLFTIKGQRYKISSNLKEIYSRLDSKKFFQINRQTIISKDSINSISPYQNRKLKIQTSIDIEIDLIIPKSKTKDFINWMEF